MSYHMCWQSYTNIHRGQTGCCGLDRKYAHLHVSTERRPHTSSHTLLHSSHTSSHTLLHSSHTYSHTLIHSSHTSSTLPLSVYTYFFPSSSSSFLPLSSSLLSIPLPLSLFLFPNSSLPLPISHHVHEILTEQNSLKTAGRKTKQTS